MKKYMLLLFCFFIILPAQGGKEIKLTIVHTNDLHSHLLGCSPNTDYTPATTGDDDTIGGWARIATLIKDVKNKRENPVLVLDAGDFLMGSLFHMLSREKAFELRTMKEMGYDLITLGNHEFDLKPDGLARILVSGDRLGGIPPIVASNLIFSKTNSDDDSLEKLLESGLIKEYTILDREGTRIGFFGLMGKDAADVAPFSKPVKFGDPIEASKKIVKILKEREKADLIICLSHSGLNPVSSKSEDEVLAREVPEIDIIISGHTHTPLAEPITIGKTIIVQSGGYGEYTGVLDVTLKESGVVLDSYRAMKIDDSIKGDPRITGLINGYMGEINRTVLAPIGMTFFQTVAETDFNLLNVERESNLGNLVADAGRWYINKHDSDPKDPASHVSFFVESNGVIRDDIIKGTSGRIAACDLFRTFPLGIGWDKEKSLGYPLITIYLYGSEIKRALEVLTSIYPIKGSNFFLQVSGVKFKYNPCRVIFDRVTDIQIEVPGKGFQPLDYSSSNTKLYRCGANLYNSFFLSFVGDFTMDILKIVPKDKEGNPVKDLPILRIDMDKKKPGIQEAKEWVALFEYMKSFQDVNGNGIPDVPARYKTTQGRIEVETGIDPVSILKGGSYVTWLAAAGLLIVIGMGVLLVALGYRVVKKVIRR